MTAIIEFALLKQFLNVDAMSRWIILLNQTELFLIIKNFHLYSSLGLDYREF